MLLYSCCSSGGHNAHSSTRRKRTEKNSLHIENGDQLTTQFIGLMCDSRKTNDRSYDKPSIIASILYDSTPADLGDQLQDTTEPKTIRIMRTPTEHGEARCVVCRNCCREFAEHFEDEGVFASRDTHASTSHDSDSERPAPDCMDGVRDGNVGGGLASPYPFLGATILRSLSAVAEEKPPILRLCARHVHGDPESFVPARLGTLDRQCDGL